MDTGLLHYNVRQFITLLLIYGGQEWTMKSTNFDPIRTVMIPQNTLKAKHSCLWFKLAVIGKDVIHILMKRKDNEKITEIKHLVFCWWWNIVGFDLCRLTAGYVSSCRVYSLSVSLLYSAYHPLNTGHLNKNSQVCTFTRFIHYIHISTSMPFHTMLSLFNSSLQH